MTTNLFRPDFRPTLIASVMVLFAAGLWLTPATVTDAAFPGTNGKIAFSSDRDGNDEIYAMNADGSSPVRLTNSAGEDSWPVWSPDGTKIAFQSTRDGVYEIYTMNADGTNPIRLTSHPATDVAPTWSPDGTKIAFQTDRDGQFEIYVMDADGANPARITTTFAEEHHPDWSPDGTMIAFSSNSSGQFEIHAMNADGTGMTQLTSNTTPGGAAVPRWSPDGTKLVFQSQLSFGNDVYVVDADGSNPTQLTTHSGVDYVPNWQPLPPADLDADDDGVDDADDRCAGTVIPEDVPTDGLGTNRWALVDGDRVFDTRLPNGRGPTRSYDTTATGGCSCRQIITALGLGNGHVRFGCSISVMDDWVAIVGSD